MRRNLRDKLLEMMKNRGRESDQELASSAGTAWNLMVRQQSAHFFFSTLPFHASVHHPSLHMSLGKTSESVCEDAELFGLFMLLSLGMLDCWLDLRQFHCG